MKSIRVGGVFAAILNVGGCASASPWACGPEEAPALLDTLYFGTDRPEGVVTPEQWKDFLNEVVTPRFSGGLTWWDASGQWRTAAGVVQREASHLLQIVHPESRDSELALREIMGRYRTRFRQEAVLRVRSQACLSY